jgi:prepilin-type N-terminal cleavage/methylation domain-containing protein
MTILRTDRKRAFTLIEVLLVLAILGVMITVMLPQVMSSLKEHQLRGATRAVISAGRHAMSLAVLSQREMSVVYDLDEATLTIRAAEESRYDTNDLVSAEGPAEDVSAWESEQWDASDELAEPADPDGAYAGAAAIVDEEVVHELDGVAFSFIEVKGEDGYRAESGTHAILYYTNGRCTPHTIGFADEDGATATIEIDALASARVLDE